MGYSWQIKPKDSMVVPIQQYAPVGIQNITIDRLKELLTAKGFNAAILVQVTRNGYTGYMIVTNFGNVDSDLNLGTDVYFDNENYTIGFTKPKSTNISQYWMWYIYRDGDGLANQTGSQWNNWAEPKTVDGVEYYVIKSNSTPTYKPIYVTTYTGNIYYHGDIPPNWVTVESISGNGQTYELSEIININDAEPVSDVGMQGNFTLYENTECDILVDAAMIDPSKVRITYEIPDEDYEYVKLVYKKDAIPNNVDDGTAIDINKSSTSRTINGISDGGRYWFVIFTDLTTSDPVSLDTMNYESVPDEYKVYTDLINKPSYNTYNYLTDNWVVKLNDYTPPSPFTFSGNMEKCSFICLRTTAYGRPTIADWSRMPDQATKCIARGRDGEYSGDFTASIYTVEPLNVYINGSGNSYTVSHSRLVSKIVFKRDGADAYGFEPYFNINAAAFNVASYVAVIGDFEDFTATGTLEECLQFICMTMRNVNIYVNGILWSAKIK